MLVEIFIWIVIVGLVLAFGSAWWNLVSSFLDRIKRRK